MKQNLTTKPNRWKRRLTTKQLKSLHQSTHRLNIWEGSVRSGKTHISLIRWVKFIQTAPAGDLLMLGRSFGTLARNIIRPMIRMIGGDAVFLPSQNLIRVWGRDIYCYGAGKADSVAVIQGMTCAGCYGDELTLWPEEVFKMMLSRMSIDGAKFFGTTNPDSPMHWLKKNWLDRADELDLKSFHFVLDDNEFLPPDYIKALKREYTGLWYKRYILGLWAVAEGVIYDFFDDKPPFVLAPEDLPEAQYYMSAIDYGTKNPFFCGLFGVNLDSHPKVWLEKEYYYSGRDNLVQKTDLDYCNDIIEFYGDIEPVKVLVDPSASSFILQGKRSGIYGLTEADNSVLDGIRTQATMLKSGQYAVSSDCPETIKEYGAFVWDEKAQLKGVDKPVKMFDHTKDGERYLLHSTFGQDYLDYDKLTTM